MRSSYENAATALLLVAGAVLAGPSPASAQQDDVAQALGLLAEDNAREYARPLSEGLGYSLNSGLAEDASVHSRLGFDFGVRVMGAFVPEERKSFAPILDQSVVVDGEEYTAADVYEPESGGPAQTPTAAGSGTGVTLVPTEDFESALVAAGEDPNDPKWQIPFPDGQGISPVPFLVLQGGLGLGFNTEITVRAIPSVESTNADVGKIQAFGLGAKHEISGWFPTIPLDVSVMAGYQGVTVGDYLDADATSLGLLVGRGLGPLHAFALAETVNPTVDVTYTVENPDANPLLPADGTVIRLSPGVDSETRVGVGANLTFLILNISAQYTLGDYDIATLKVGLSFR